jgi:hypothetical protein
MFPSGSRFVPIRFTMGSQHIYRIMSIEREREREREITTYLIWYFPKLDFFLKKIVMDQSKTRWRQDDFKENSNI